MVMTIREMKELNGECCQDNCSNVGTHYVYWPGQGNKRMCLEHARKAEEISRVMGFSLHIEEIHDNPRTKKNIQ